MVGGDMWQVHNLTPFAADRSWIRDRDGAEVWLVAVRCTFDIHANGTTTPATEQGPVMLAPKYFGDAATTSLQYDTDFVLTKPTTDVVLHGSAYAPRGKAVTSVDVTMQVGHMRKALRVVGERRYRKSFVGLTTEDPKPFLKLPISYERTFGGGEQPSAAQQKAHFEQRNPIGVGYVPVVGLPVPSVEYPGAMNGKRPAGFGPIPPHWRPRVDHAGTYDGAWKKTRHPLYPQDLDDRFFLCSPEDQRPATFLRGGEPIELTNLTPSGRLSFLLPRVSLGFQTVFRTGEKVRHRGELYTVILEPDVSRVVLVYRTSLPCHPKVQDLMGTLVWQKRIRAAQQGLALRADVEEEDEGPP